MRTFIQQGTYKTDALATQVDSALVHIEQLARQGAVGNKVYSTDRSQFFVDGGVPKFYNATTGETKTVSFEEG